MRERLKVIGAGCGALVMVSGLACLLVIVFSRQLISAASRLGLESTRPLPGRFGLRAGDDLLGYAGQQIDGKGYEAMVVYSYPDTDADGAAIHCNLRSTSIIGLRPRPDPPGQRRVPGQPRYVGFLPLSAISRTTCTCFSATDSRISVRTCQLPVDVPARWR